MLGTMVGLWWKQGSKEVVGGHFKVQYFHSNAHSCPPEATDESYLHVHHFTSIAVTMAAIVMSQYVDRLTLVV